MDELNNRVLKAFDIKGANITKEKGSYKVQSKDGWKLIRKTGIALDNIQFQHGIKEFMYESGFTFIDRFYYSTQNKPYFILDGHMYTMTDYIKYPEVCFGNNGEFIKIIEMTAQMHRLLMCVHNKDIEVKSDNLFAHDEDLIDIYEKSVKQLKKIKAGLNIEKRLSDLDVIFLKNYEYYLSLAEEALTQLKETKLNALAERSKNKGFIRHNGLKEENIFINGQNVYITNFFESCIGYYLFDLIDLINRYMKNLPENYLTINEIINIYNTYNPLLTDELKILSAILKFPQRFMKICSQYYSKKHSFIPGSTKQRMMKEINGRPVYDTYLKSFKISE